ncbi:conserved hypothetical protein [Curtobacterium sp. 8I-2]|nr:conserved hypothetical protein [Curtobacterium sp. 8I-2]
MGRRRVRSAERSGGELELLAGVDQVRVVDGRRVRGPELLPAALDLELRRDRVERVTRGDRVRLAARLDRGRLARRGRCRGRRRLGGARRGLLRGSLLGGGRSRSRRLRGGLLGRSRSRRGRRRGRCGSRTAGAAQSELGGACGPGTPALRGEDALGDGDLGLAAGGGGVASATVRLPGAEVELQAAVVAVAGVDGPVAAGLALRELVPGRTGRCVRGGCREADTGRGDAGERQAADDGAGTGKLLHVIAPPGSRAASAAGSTAHPDRSRSVVGCATGGSGHRAGGTSVGNHRKLFTVIKLRQTVLPVHAMYPWRKPVRLDSHGHGHRPVPGYVTLAIPWQ